MSVTGARASGRRAAARREVACQQADVISAAAVSVADFPAKTRRGGQEGATEPLIAPTEKGGRWASDRGVTQRVSARG